MLLYLKKHILIVIPVITLLIGWFIQEKFVVGTYEWFGLARICFELFDRPGFWCIGFAIWISGLTSHKTLENWHQHINDRRLTYRWFAVFSASFGLACVAPWKLPAGSMLDLISLCLLLSGLLIKLFHRHKCCMATLRSLSICFLIGLAIFIAYTVIAYFHTMIKGSLFILTLPNDQALWKLDSLLLGSNYYSEVSHWRQIHPELVEWLDVVYIGLLQQVCWSPLFFLGTGNKTTARRYLLAMFLIYSIGPLMYFLAPSLGPIFFTPELYTDLRYTATDSWHLSRFLTTSTESTILGQAHTISPFGYIAAFPSLHVGIALIMLISMRHSTPATCFNLFLLLFTIAATNILGWHYASDLVAGLFLGALCWYIATKFEENKEPFCQSSRSNQ